METVIIRAVRPDDLDRIAAIEAACFPASEAAPHEAFKLRIATFPDFFLVAEIDGRIIGFINGCVTDSPVIFDELFHDAKLHLPHGQNLCVFGLDVMPEFRKQGIASRLMNDFISTARNSGRKKVILTCKARLVAYYETFGYVNDGLSASSHGGAQWFDMTLTL